MTFQRLSQLFGPGGAIFLALQGFGTTVTTGDPPMTSESPQIVIGNHVIIMDMNHDCQFLTITNHRL